MIDHKNQIGLVSWFNDSKGYGFLDLGTTTTNGERRVVLDSIYVHYTEIKGDGFKTLSEGQEVEFDLTHTPKGPTASNVRKIIPT